MARKSKPKAAKVNKPSKGGSLFGNLPGKVAAPTKGNLPGKVATPTKGNLPGRMPVSGNFPSQVAAPIKGNLPGKVATPMRSTPPTAAGVVAKPIKFPSMGTGAATMSSPTAPKPTAPIAPPKMMGTGAKLGKGNF